MKPSATRAAHGGESKPERASYWNEFFRGSVPQTFPPGIELLQQGTLVREVYFIKQGLVKLSHTDEQGSEVIHALRRPGWIVGVYAAMDKKPMPLTATTLVKCEVCRLPTAELHRLSETDLTFSHALVRLLSARAYEDVARQVMLSLSSASDRLLQFFSQFLPDGPAPASGEFQLHIPLKDGDIARYLAINPSTLSRVYKRLEEKGIIRRRKGWTIIRQPEWLRSQADPIHRAWKLRGGRSWRGRVTGNSTF
jgi:CRP/FNR family transcriptional regulator, cyclic AMP receptor protein